MAQVEACYYVYVSPPCCLVRVARCALSWFHHVGYAFDGNADVCYGGRIPMVTETRQR
jgi:hypothetical protein